MGGRGGGGGGGGEKGREVRKEREGGGKLYNLDCGWGYWVANALHSVISHRTKEQYLLPAEESPLLERRTVSETEAIFDEILSQLHNASR